MTADRPSIPQAATQAWRDTGAAFRALRGLALTAFLITTGLALLKELALPESDSGATAALLVGFIESSAQAFLLTSYLIAVHRFIILGELTPRYESSATASTARERAYHPQYSNRP